MKLIIDIDEQYYKDLKKITPYVCSEAITAIRCGTPLEEELENIKSDIKEILSINNERDMLLPASYICKLVDKHIAELKGENK